MPARLRAHARAARQPEPSSPAELARCIIDSLALAYRRAIDDAARLSGRQVSVVHVVGGGSQDELLCQATADATGLPEIGGPHVGAPVTWPPRMPALARQSKLVGDLAQRRAA